MKTAARAMTLTGAALLAVVLGAAVLAPLITPTDPNEIHLHERLSPPSWKHPLGTDQLGRDLLSRILHGARISMAVGIFAVTLSVILGVAVGTMAGYQGGWVDALLMRGVDILYSFPTIFLILSAVAFLGPSLINIVVIIGLTSWMGLSRLVRAEVLSLKEREFILAARGIGASPSRIILRHLIPNALHPVVVNAALGIGSAILIESALSFLGIGVQLPTPTWGNILSEGKATLGFAWWLSVFPGISIFWVILGCNLLGEGLRRESTRE